MAISLRMMAYAERKGIRPCACGCNDLVVWEPPSDPKDVNALEKIECKRCGATVWGSDDDAIAQWNAHEYDEPGKLP